MSQVTQLAGTTLDPGVLSPQLSSSRCFLQRSLTQMRGTQRHEWTWQREPGLWNQHI